MTLIDTSVAIAASIEPAGRELQMDRDACSFVDWANLRPHEHFVQMYEHDDALVNAVSGYVTAGIRQGEACVVIGYPQHVDALERALSDRGIDIAVAMTQGQYVALDAGKTLGSIMVDGMPCPDRFRDVIGPVIEGAAARGPGVRAFGEMVDDLWSRGMHRAAIELERLWNDLAGTHRFSLFCAYSMGNMAGDDLAAPFLEVCSSHTRVIPAESYANIDDADQRLQQIALLQQKAITLEAEVARSRQAEAELARREQELSEFFDNALEGIHKVGPDGTILWANRAEMELLGYPPEEYIGHNITEFHADSDAINDMLSKLTCGEVLCNYPARLRCRDGSIKHVLVHSNAHFENGEFIHTRCFTRDVTDRKLMEDALHDRMREIELLNDRLKRSMTETHHRVKNNLQVVSALIEMQMSERVGEPEADQEFAGQLDRLQAHIRALAVVHNVLTHAIHENEDAQLISTKAVLDKLFPILQQTACEQEIRYSVDDIDLPSKQCVSLALLLNELVSNALKHGRKTAEVTLTAAGNEATLEVCDDGPGFPADFDPASFANMGLELVHGLVRTDLAGRIRYENRPMGGGRIRVVFPLPNSPAFPTERPRSGAPQGEAKARANSNETGVTL